MLYETVLVPRYGVKKYVRKEFCAIDLSLRAVHINTSLCILKIQKTLTIQLIYCIVL